MYDYIELIINFISAGGHTQKARPLHAYAWCLNTKVILKFKKASNFCAFICARGIIFAKFCSMHIHTQLNYA